MAWQNTLAVMNTSPKLGRRWLASDTLELRGHGDSEGKQGHVDRWHAYVEDVQAAVSTIGRPFVMVAHSMGGMVAISTLSEPLTLSGRTVESAVGRPRRYPSGSEKPPTVVSIGSKLQTMVNTAMLSYDKDSRL